MLDEIAILHTADWHVCDEFLDDATACLRALCVKADMIIPELIVISGDIYNHRQIRQESEAARLALETIRRLAKIAPVCILVGTPSHDGNAPLIVNAINERCPVWIADKPDSFVLYLEKHGNQAVFEHPKTPLLRDDLEPIAFISTVPAFTKQHFQTISDIQTSDKEIAKHLGALFAKFGSDNKEFQINLRRDPDMSGPVPHILLGHWSIGGAFIHPNQAITGLDIEVAREHIDLANANIVCMGHIHAQQKIGDNIFYPGSLFATDFGEMEAKGFYVHTLELVDMGGHWQVANSEFIHTPSPLLLKLENDLLQITDKDFPNIAIISTLQTLSANPHAIIRHEVKIYQDMAHTIDEERIKTIAAERIGARKYELNIRRLPRPNVRSARVLEVETLRDKLKTRADIINEPISEEILGKADLLENAEPDQIYRAVQKGVQI